MDRQFSILLLGTQMAIGGAQKLLLDQARWFQVHGHRVTAAFFYDKQDLQRVWREGLAFPLLTLAPIGTSQAPTKKIWGLILGWFRLWALLRRGRFDVIETFTYDSNLLALPLAWLARVPVRIATHHGMIEGLPRWLERLHSWMINVGIASTLVSVSSKALEQAAKAGTRREKMVVIHNGIPPISDASTNRPGTRKELGLTDSDVLLLSVGRLVYQKGHEYLIEAMPRILARFPSVRVLICGDGPLRGELQSHIDRMHLQEPVKLLGNRNDIDRFLQSADIFVLPSRWEGLPVALLEAMGMGLPVVATQVEGVDEVLERDTDGLLVPPEDAMALGEALLRLIASAALRRNMGAAARGRIQESYTLDIMCEKYLVVMRSLVRGT